MIPLSKPSIFEDEINEVIKVLKSGWLTHGAKNDEFEKLFAEFTGTRRAVTLNSCASALQLALLAKGIKSGDEVLVPSFTHVATANSVVNCGGKPVFVDADIETFNIDVEDAMKKITEKTKAIIPVHFAGLPCDMKSITEISEKNNLAVIEDAAEALGSEFNGRKVGTFGIGCFSFFPTKQIATGEGGMVTTNEDEIADEIARMSAHGMDKSTWARSYAKYPWQRIQKTIGFNFRMSNFQAALGLEQLKRIDKILNSRIEIASRITNFLEKFDFIVPQAATENCKHTYQIYTARIVGKDRKTFLEKLQKEGIGVSVHFDPPVHLQPYYTNLFGKISLPKTEEISSTVFTLPIYPDMTDEELNEMFTKIEKVSKEI